MTLALPRLIAHRGASAYAPENTIAAMEHAKQHHAHWVEFDVTLTADGIPVIFHDDTLDRTTNGSGCIHEKTYAELQRLDAGAWYDPTFKDQPIPTLLEVLQCTARLGLGINVELKPGTHQTLTLVETTLAIVDELWPVQLPAPLFSSFTWETACAVREQAPDCQLGLLLDSWDPDWEMGADRLNAVTIHLAAPLVTPERVEAIHATDRLVLSYTVNTREQANRFFHYGVDSVFTDDPDLLS